MFLVSILATGACVMDVNPFIIQQFREVKKWTGNRNCFVFHPKFLIISFTRIWLHTEYVELGLKHINLCRSIRSSYIHLFGHIYTEKR